MDICIQLQLLLPFPTVHIINVNCTQNTDEAVAMIQFIFLDVLYLVRQIGDGPNLQTWGQNYFISLEMSL